MVYQDAGAVVQETAPVITLGWKWLFQARTPGREETCVAIRSIRDAGLPVFRYDICTQSSHEPVRRKLDLERLSALLIYDPLAVGTCWTS